MMPYTLDMMHRRIGLIAALLCCAAAGRADVPADSFDRYKVIIEKNPFRKSSPVAGIPAAASQNWQLVGIFCTGANCKVFIRDLKGGKSHYLAEGDALGDSRIEKIDVENQTVIVATGVERHSLKFPERPAAVAAAPPAPQRPAYRGPGRPPPAAAVPTTVTPANPAAVVPVQQPAAPSAAAPTAMRRRILRQQGAPQAAPTPPPAQSEPPPQPVQPEAQPEEAPAAEHAEQPAEAPAEQ